MKKLLLKSGKTILLILLLIVTSVSRGQSTKTFAASAIVAGTGFTPPAGVTTIQVEAYGGGGGGGYGGTTSKYGGGGGGGGGYTINTSMTVVPGTEYLPITIGGGGVGATVSGGTAGNGTSTSATFASSSITATGGSAGKSFSTTGPPANQGPGGAGGTGTRSGGTGGTGNTTGSGGGGGCGGTTSNGGNGNIPTAGTSGGGAYAGAGGAGSTSNTAAGSNGATGFYGGGGGGGTRNSSGGSGKPGFMIITYTCPTYGFTSITAPNRCGAGTSTITLNSTATNLPVGTYDVSYTATGGYTPASGTFTMTVTTAGTGTFTTGTIALGTTANFTITSISSFTYCPTTISTGNTFSVTAYNTPTSNAGSNINTCASSGAVNITAGASASNASTVLWTSNGTGTFTNPGTTAACTYNPSAADITAGTVTLTFTASNAGCSSVSSTKSFIIAQAMNPNAGPPTSFCSNSFPTITTSAATASNQTSQVWTILSGAGSLTNATSLTACTYTPTATELANGATIQLTLTTSNAGCANETSIKVVTIYAVPTANAGTPIITCPSAGAVNITAGAITTNATSITWSSSGSGTFANPTSLTTCTYTPSAADITAGSVTITLTASNSGCPTATANKTLTISNSMNPNAGATTSVCASSAITTATATASNQTSQVWTILSGSGSLTNATSLTACTYTPSATELANGATIQLTLTTSNAGCSNETSIKVVNLYPVPTSNAGTAINICTLPLSGATNITTGATATNYTSVLWTSSGTAGTLTNATSLTACTYTPNAVDALSGTITLTLTVNGTSPCGSVTSTKTITYRALVTANAGTPITICASTTSVNITTASSASATATATTWTTNGAGTLANANSLTTCVYTPSAAELASGAVINLTLTASNGGCADATSTKTLTINPMIPASVVIAASPSTTICAGTNVTFTATPTNGGTAPSYQWRVNGSNVGTNSPVFTSSTLVNANTVTCVLISNATPCLTGSPATSNTIPMTVNPSLTPSVLISTASTSVCAGIGVTFTATPTNGGTTPSYQWKVNGANVGTDSPTYSTSTLANSNTVTCVMTSNATPCLVTPTATSNTITMTVNPYLIASVSVSATATTICSGTNVTFTATPTNGGTTPTYQWTLNSSNVGTNSATYSSTTLTDGDQVICTMTSNIASCLLGSPATSNTVTMSVTTTPTVATTTPGSRTGTGTVVLGATASTGSLNWYSVLSGGTVLGTGTSFTTPSISATTTYYVEAVNGSCPSTPRTAVIATVYAPEMDVQGNSTSIVDGDITPVASDWTNFNGAYSRIFTIYNTGTGILNIGAISFTGTNAAEFSINVSPATSVAAGGNTSFTVQFTPTGTGTRTATISIANDDADENPYDFSIQGSGSAAEINVQGNSTNIVSGDTTPSTADWTDFSNLTITRTFTIQNLGGINLTVTGITFVGGNASDFSLVGAPTFPLTIAGTTSTTFTVKFTAGAITARSTTVTIANSDSNESSYNFKIQALTAGINMNVKAAAVLIADGDVTPSTSDWTDFGTTNVSSPITRTFTIENTGTNSLVLNGTPKVAFIAGSSPEFTITTQPTSPVLTSSTTTFVVTFSPTTTGSKTAGITISNNDGQTVSGNAKNPYTFSIQANAIQAFVDSDGDGVYDNLDSDDDNDGIPDNVEQSYASGSVLGTQVTVTVLNETFGTGTTRGRINDNVSSASTTYCWEDGLANNNAVDECDTDYSLNDGQYTVGNSAQIASWAATYWYTGPDHTTGDTNGKMGLFNATNNITEEFYRTTLQGIIANAPLTYSFWVLNLDRTDAPSIDTRNRPNITVEFRDLSNNLISTINTGDISPTTAGNAAGNWYQFSASFTPVTTGFSIIFRNNQIGGTGNDLALDDILITQKLTDSDQDGKADLYDLDSDNDGIGDIYEDEWTAYAESGKDYINKTGSWDANTNGWLDAAETRYAITPTAKDFDGDGVPNHIDLDSDNDSVFDVDEGGLYNAAGNGDGDVNGDGEGEGTDTDGDGILSLFDTYTGYGNTGKAAPVTTLVSSTKPDYLNLISQTSGVYDISKTLYASLDTNNDGKIDGTADVDKDGILDAFDTNTAFYGSPRNLNRKLYLDFDGRNDYAEDSAILGGLSNATIMAWVDLNSAYGAIGVVVGQDKFHIRITGSKILQVVANGSILSAPTALNTAQWYHVAASYGGGNLNLYLNGKLVASQTVSGSIAADATKLTLGKSPSSSTFYFKGKIDEVRVFNVTLTDAQVQRQVYQEIQNSSSQVRGTVVPRDIGTLPYTNVLRNYRMDAYKNDIVDNVTTAAIDTGTGMKLYNHKVIAVQQAPMPFTTITTATSFAAAINDTTNDIRGLDATELDYSIIQVNHDVSDTANNTDLGMFVSSGKTITMNNNTKLQNDWYLKLDGKIDLAGKSQLVQTTSSILDATSAGSIERDQQGQSNKYNYNYWSSPVSTINTTSNNNGFTVAGVMKDGTTSTPQSFLWTTGVNSSATSPITLSSYWIFKFQNSTNAYANWSSVGQNGALLAGQGYTLKGSSAATADQNFTFAGKPNNGTITSVVGPNNLNLCGNPYASAIDANQFIDDNITTTTGTLYIWQHYNTNSSHNTIQYQGGYATYTKAGGTAPVAPAGVSGLGSSSKIPYRFIPVGQGFFVTGSATGGTITFNNAQRLFIKEDDVATDAVYVPIGTPLSYTMFRPANPTVASVDPAMNNAHDNFVQEQFMKIRLGYNSTDNLHRQTLLAFMNDHATAGYDNGYDGISIETLTNDMYFINGTNKLNIDADGNFNVNNIYPLGVKNATAGNVTFVVDGKENFDANQEIYIYDNVTSTYNSIKSQNFQVNLPAGTYDSRFSLRFRNAAALGTDENQQPNHGVTVNHSQSDNMINIKNELQEVTVKSVMLFNLLGQNVASWNVENQEQSDMHLPVSDLSTGTYIVKVITDGGEITKKILVKK